MNGPGGPISSAADGTLKFDNNAAIEGRVPTVLQYLNEGGPTSPLKKPHFSP